MRDRQTGVGGAGEGYETNSRETEIEILVSKLQVHVLARSQQAGKPLEAS